MGQYYLLVNVSKKEYIDPHKIHEGAKFYELVSGSSMGVLLLFLLHKSDAIAYGDVEDPQNYKYLGHWSGDEVYLVGDYDSSQLYTYAKAKFRDITADVVEEYNRFMNGERLIRVSKA